jgi:hypothetical protein
MVDGFGNHEQQKTWEHMMGTWIHKKTSTTIGK